MRPFRASLAPVILAVPLLAGSRCTPTPEEPQATVPSGATAPEVQLQVFSLEPAAGPQATSFEVTVFGSAFQDGAGVRLQEREADGVAWRDENTLRVTVPALEAGVYDVEVVNPDGGRAVLWRGLTVLESDASEACRSFTVWFDFDASEVRADGLSILSERASCLQQARGAIRVEGHCDERGTTEYNLALGERRAHAVRRAIVGLGVAPSRIETLSFGEERPLETGNDEDAWSRNRRAEIQLEH
ncbi:MAG: OmpA family protein [Deltaproteobacteria bacterium]|nr:OmpA family protein [Deltaproteobacteria bacterium]